MFPEISMRIYTFVRRVNTCADLQHTFNIHEHMAENNAQLIRDAAVHVGQQVSSLRLRLRFRFRSSQSVSQHQLWLHDIRHISCSEGFSMPQGHPKRMSTIHTKM